MCAWVLHWVVVASSWTRFVMSLCFITKIKILKTIARVFNCVPVSSTHWKEVTCQRFSKIIVLDEEIVSFHCLSVTKDKEYLRTCRFNRLNGHFRRCFGVYIVFVHVVLSVSVHRCRNPHLPTSRWTSILSWIKGSAISSWTYLWVTEW